MKSSSNLPKRTFRDHFSFKMTPNNAAHWEHTRKKGKMRFILLFGFLGWGGIMGIYNYFKEVNLDETFDLSMLVSTFLFWGLAGLFFGYFLWTILDKQYQSYKNKNQV